LIKMLEYIRYLDIKYPPKLQFLLDSQSKGSVGLNLKVALPPKIEQRFANNHTIPERFSRYHLVSSFFLNYWEALFTLAVLLTIIVAIVFSAFLTRRIKLIGSLLAKVRDVLKWNLFLMLLCTNLDGVGLFSSLIFLNASMATPWAGLDLALCIMMNMAVIYLIFKIPYIIFYLKRSRRRVFSMVSSLDAKDTSVTIEMKERIISNRYENCDILFRNFKRATFLQHSCMFFILLRIYLFNMIVGYLFKYPLVQASLILLMSILILLYLSIKRPFKRPVELLKNLAYESVIIVVNIMVFIFAILDHKRIEAKDLRVRMGDIVVMANMVFNFLALFFIFADMLVRIVKVWQMRKTVKETGIQYWITIGQLLIKPEEMEDDPPFVGKEAKELNSPAKRVLQQRHQKLNPHMNMDDFFTKPKFVRRSVKNLSNNNSSVPFHSSACNSPQNYSFTSTSNFFETPKSRIHLLPSTQNVEFLKLDNHGFSDNEDDLEKRSHHLDIQTHGTIHHELEFLKPDSNSILLSMKDIGEKLNKKTESEPRVNILLQNRGLGPRDKDRNRIRRKALEGRKKAAKTVDELKTITIHDVGPTLESHRIGSSDHSLVALEGLRSSQEVLLNILKPKK